VDLSIEVNFQSGIDSTNIYKSPGNVRRYDTINSTASYFPHISRLDSNKELVGLRIP
jgi:hypothetical protein